jgi:hypothetical protein
MGHPRKSPSSFCETYFLARFSTPILDCSRCSRLLSTAFSHLDRLWIRRNHSYLFDLCSADGKERGDFQCRRRKSCCFEIVCQARVKAPIPKVLCFEILWLATEGVPIPKGLSSPATKGRPREQSTEHPRGRSMTCSVKDETSEIESRCRPYCHHLSAGLQLDRRASVRWATLRERKRARTWM